ncbi:MAG TPA: hypothetical protein PK303_04825 [bacterium]|nr:hypothetical protein [bacterium]
MNIALTGIGWRKQFAKDVIKRLGIIFNQTTSEDADMVFVCNYNQVSSDEIRYLVKNGKNVIFLQPEKDLLNVFGNELMYTYHFPLMQIEGHLPVTFLQVFPPVSLVKQKHGETIGLFALDFSSSGENYTTGYPAISWRKMGSGAIAMFFYDFISTLLLLLQGWEFFTEEGRLSRQFRTGISRATHLADYLILRQLCEIPQGYFHEILLLKLIRTLLAGKNPVPRIWYYPYPDTTVFLLSGDSDNLEKHNLEKAWELIVNSGAEYTQYTMVDDIGLFSEKELSQWKQKGIDFELHYYAGPSPSSEEMLQHLVKAKKMFLSKKIKVDSCRGHSLIWTGWDKQIKIMEKAGFLFSSNLLYWYPGISYGLPYYLYTNSGKSSVQELQIFVSDDVCLFNKSGLLPLTPPVYLKKIIAWLDINKDVYYQPFNPIFHPYYLVKQPSTQEVLKQSIIHAKSSGIPIMNHRRFFSWWNKRGSMKLKYQLNDTCVEFSSARTDAETGIALPETWDGMKITGGVKLQTTGEILFPLNCRKITYQKGEK